MSDKINPGLSIVSGSFFHLKKISIKGSLPIRNKVDDGGEIFHSFTYKGLESTTRKDLIRLIDGAKQKIFIASFRIGDKQLFNALHRAANRLKGGIYVITALDSKTLERGLSIEEDFDGDKAAQNYSYEGLTENGIYVRGHSSCHAKFIVVDDEVALVSSANFEKPAFEKTGESGIVTGDLIEVNRLARLFAYLWEEGCDWEVPPGENYIVRERVPGKSKVSPFSPEIGCVPSAIWTCGSQTLILNTIHDIIDRTQNDLTLASFSLCEMSKNRWILLDPLEKAIRERRIKVRLLVRARNNILGHRLDAAEFSKIGVEVFGDSENHAKGIFSDGKYGAIFSANFDAKHGLTNGVEVGYRLDGTRALEEAYAYFDFSIKNSDLNLVSNPTNEQMAKSLGARWKQNLPTDRIIVKNVEDATWNTFKKNSDKGPCLFLERNKGVLNIYTGGGLWHLKGDIIRGECRLECVERPSDPKHTYELMEEWLTNRTNESVYKGFFDAELTKV